SAGTREAVPAAGHARRWTHARRRWAASTATSSRSSRGATPRESREGRPEDSAQTPADATQPGHYHRRRVGHSTQAPAGATLEARCHHSAHRQVLMLRRVLPISLLVGWLLPS